MHRRKLITGIATAGALSLAGCSGSSDTTESDSQDEEEDSIDIQGQQFYFQDETGTLGHIAHENPPENTPDWQTINNKLTEDEWKEKQINDIEKANKKEYKGAPTPNGLNEDMDWMLNRTKELFQNPSMVDVPFPKHLEPSIQKEDNEITFTRALIQATQEAGVDSSGLSDDMVANMAEYAEQELDIVNFNNYKLSTLPSCEAVSAANPGGHVGGVKDGGGNSGFTHMAGLLQYQKNGETELKYTEMTQAAQANKFKHSIREPEESVYRSDIEQGQLDTGQWPHHFVTSLDYTKVREIEAKDENIMGFGEVPGSDGYQVSLGDIIERFLVNLVDDSGHNSLLDETEAEEKGGSCLVSDEFGESLEHDYLLDPDPESRQYVENIARGIYQIGEQMGWNTEMVLTGTIDEPEMRITERETANEVRKQHAYDQVREMVSG